MWNKRRGTRAYMKHTRQKDGHTKAMHDNGTYNVEGKRE